MTEKEMYFTMYASVAQGVLEAKLGVVGEVAPDLLADDCIRITDALMAKFNEKFRG